MYKYIRYNSLPSFQCDLIYDIPDRNIEPTYTKKQQVIFQNGMRIFVKTDLLNWFIDHILHQLKITFVLFTGNSICHLRHIYI